jgi:hemolysin activation/secretion protein
MRFTRAQGLWARALVIIATALSGAAAGAGTDLTTPAPVSQASSATTLTTVIIDGSSVYSHPQLFATYRDQLGEPYSRETTRVIASALANLYVQDGYVKPEFTQDESLTSRGVLRLRVYEAQVSRVIFEGDEGKAGEALDEIGARLEHARPLRKDDVAQALRAMRQIAGLAVTATTRKDQDLRNAFELVVNADYSPIDGVVRMNNRGTDEVGPAFMLGQVFANGLLGGQEKIGLIFAAATDHDEFLGGGIYFDTPFGDSGTRGNAMLFRSHSAPNEAPVNLEDEYVRERVTLRVTKPFKQSSAFSLSGGLGFEADDLTIDRAGDIVRDDRLRILEGVLRTNWRTGDTQWSANLQVRQGLDGLGSGLDAEDLANDPRRADFIVMQMQGSVFRRFADRWSVRFDAFAQNSGYVLPDSERFKIGGDRLGRGFEVAEIAGDSGIGGKIDLRRDMLDTGTMAGRLSAYGFYDAGAAWKQDAPGRESAATAGTGIALQGAALTGYLEVAAPLTGPDIEGKQTASVFAEISYRF